MSRTSKWEHRTDGWHIGRRLERQARPPQRDREAFYADLDLGEDRVLLWTAHGDQVDSAKARALMAFDSGEDRLSALVQFWGDVDTIKEER